MWEWGRDKIEVVCKISVFWKPGFFERLAYIETIAVFLSYLIKAASTGYREGDKRSMLPPIK